MAAAESGRAGARGGTRPCGGGAGFLYFAYGSNLNPARMRARCPGARFVGTATLRGWRLVERLYADVERAAGGSVRGAVYWLGRADLDALCRYEGAPRVYRCGMVTAWLDGRGWADCLTFAMTGRTRAERDGRPYPGWYRAVCSEGARARGIRDDFAVANVG